MILFGCQPLFKAFELSDYSLLTQVTGSFKYFLKNWFTEHRTTDFWFWLQAMFTCPRVYKFTSYRAQLIKSSIL
jgi:hypothetical protein